MTEIPSTHRIRALILEDNSFDAELVIHELKKAGFDVDWRRVESEAEYLAHLGPDLNVILSDYNLPQFDVPRALSLLREQRLDIPFIIVSGSIGEDAAVAAMKLGADDYLLKDRLARLGQSVSQVIANQRLREERRHVESALRESEERYRLLVESSPDAIFIHSNRIIAFCNSAATELAGIPRARELIGRPIASLFHPDDRRVFDESYAEHRPSGKRPVHELRFLRADQSILEVESIETQLLFDGQPAAQLIVRDIAERKRAQRRIAVFSDLGQKLSGSKTVAEAANIIVDAADRLHPWDACFFDLYSHKENQVENVLTVDTIGGVRVTCHPVCDRSPPSPRTRRAIIEGGFLISRDDPAAAESEPVRFGDTGKASASALFAPVRNGAEVIGIISIQSYTPNAYGPADLSALLSLADYCGAAVSRIQGEEERARLARQMQLLLESTGEGIYGVDAAGSCTFINKSGAALLGFDPSEMLGQNIHALIRSIRPDGAVAAPEAGGLNRSVLEGGQSPNPSDVYWRKDGKPISVECSSFPIYEAGNVTGSVVIFSDVSQRRQMEAQLRQLQKLEAVGQLAAGVAHDFNNILTVVQGHASLIQIYDNLPESLLDSVKQIQLASDRAANLTRQLLAFSRKLVIQPVELDLNEVVGSMAKMLRRVLGEDIQLVLDSACRLPMIRADAGMMDQILLNLAVNSRDAMPRGGRLIITTSARSIDGAYVQSNPEAQPGEFVCLSVTDTGHGIAPEHLTRIFEPFFTTKGPTKGTGLGLATVYGIVKQHNGWITVRSVVGQGTTFEVFLRSAGYRTATSAEETAYSDLPHGSETLLLIEDDSSVLRATRRFLEYLGYKILDASNGPDALDLVRGNKSEIKLVLTDVILPGGMTGLEVAEQAMQESDALKIMFTSGYTGNVLNDRLLSSSEVWFVQKPCHPSKLARSIRDCLDGKPPYPIET